MVKKVFKTEDGSEFENREMAVAHEFDCEAEKGGLHNSHAFLRLVSVSQKTSTARHYVSSFLRFLAEVLPYATSDERLAAKITEMETKNKASQNESDAIQEEDEDADELDDEDEDEYPRRTPAKKQAKRKY